MFGYLDPGSGDSGISVLVLIAAVVVLAALVGACVALWVRRRG